VLISWASRDSRLSQAWAFTMMLFRPKYHGSEGLPPQFYFCRRTLTWIELLDEPSPKTRLELG
jgi:hypothetical protein